jgi:hypothetical protein
MLSAASSDASVRSQFYPIQRCDAKLTLKITIPSNQQRIHASLACWIINDLFLTRNMTVIHRAQIFLKGERCQWWQLQHTFQFDPGPMVLSQISQTIPVICWITLQLPVVTVLKYLVCAVILLDTYDVCSAETRISLNYTKYIHWFGFLYNLLMYMYWPKVTDGSAHFLYR